MREEKWLEFSPKSGILHRKIDKEGEKRWNSEDLLLPEVEPSDEIVVKENS